MVCLTTRLLGLLFDRLNLQTDLDLFSNRHPSSFEDFVPGQTEVFAIDFSGRFEPGDFVPPAVFVASQILTVQYHFLSLVTDSEVSNYGDVRAASGNFFADKAHLRKSLDGKEIFTAQVIVPLLDPGIDGACSD